MSLNTGFGQEGSRFPGVDLVDLSRVWAEPAPIPEKEVRKSRAVHCPKEALANSLACELQSWFRSSIFGVMASCLGLSLP